MQLQLYLTDDNGIKFYDACPSRDVFLVFSSSTDTNELTASISLRAPTATPLDEVITVYSDSQCTI